MQKCVYCHGGYNTCHTYVCDHSGYDMTFMAYFCGVTRWLLHYHHVISHSIPTICYINNLRVTNTTCVILTNFLITLQTTIWLHYQNTCAQKHMWPVVDVRMWGGLYKITSGQLSLTYPIFGHDLKVKSMHATTGQ